MLMLWLTHAQARHLLERLDDPDMRRQLEREIRSDVIPCDEWPVRVIYERAPDAEGQLVPVAVSYYSHEAADAAAERWWKVLVEEAAEARNADEKVG